MKNIVFFIFISSIAFAFNDVPKRQWNHLNSPSHFYTSFDNRLDHLSLLGSAERPAWSGYYWPHKWGGIALRWNQVQDFRKVPYRVTPFSYRQPSPKKFRRMSFKQKLNLSPAEKYDIFMERFDYPTVKKELTRTKFEDPLWFGVCEGWTSASIKFKEPGAFNIKTRHGLLPFASSDIKALLSYHESQFNPEAIASIGRRCNKGLDIECWDTNPASFHIVLANHIGVLKKSFAMDVDPSVEVWNQPVHSYKAEIFNKSGISPKAAPGTVREVIAKTKVQYIQESTPQYRKLPHSIAKSVVYEYTLELDAQGHIIGGEWISKLRPDFLWLPSEVDFNKTDYYSRIKDLYELSL